MTCPICFGARWVCEDHPAQVWRHDSCGGAGVPCACNPDGEVDWSEVFASADDDDATVTSCPPTKRH